MKVLHIISCLVKADGHSQFCMTIAENMDAHGMVHKIFSLPSENGVALPDSKRLIHYASGLLMCVSNVSVHLGLKKQIKTLACGFKPDVVHLHGGWHPVLFFGARVAKHMGIPIVLSLHGSLRPAVVDGDKRFKKLLAWRLYQRRLVELADVIHVSTDIEAKDVARLGFDKPVVVVPNGICSEMFVRLPDRKAFDQRWPECRGKHVALFLSRIHPLKGLDLLVSAWSCVAFSFPNWHLLIAGPNENEHEAEIKRMVNRAGLSMCVTFCGPLYEEERAKVMALADLFVLPSRSENFGMVVAESLACGVPVITTKGTPWSELLGNPASAAGRYCECELADANETDTKAPTDKASTADLSTDARMNSRANELATSGRCGWWIDIGVDSLIEALKEAMSLTDEERHEMGANGRRLVSAKYRWERVAVEIETLYEKLVSSSNE